MLDMSELGLLMEFILSHLHAGTVMMKANTHEVQTMHCPQLWNALYLWKLDSHPSL